MALLWLARACAAAEDIAGSLEAYERFLVGWQGADPDVPVLLEAREEHRRLELGTSPAGSSVHEG